MSLRLHIFGASGTGASTIGRAVAERYDLLLLDADEFYWEPTDPPFVKTRPIEERWRLMFEKIGDCDRWVIAGSIDSWSEPFLSLFDVVFFLDVPTAIRLDRLRRREQKDFGARIEPGGDMHEIYTEFIDFASKYDAGTSYGRNRQRHEEWMKGVQCPLIRIAGAFPIANILTRIDSALRDRSLV